MKANAVSRLLSCLLWIDHYNECSGMTSFMEFMKKLFWTENLRFRNFCPPPGNFASYATAWGTFLHCLLENPALAILGECLQKTTVVWLANYKLVHFSLMSLFKRSLRHLIGVAMTKVTPEGLTLMVKFWEGVNCPSEWPSITSMILKDLAEVNPNLFKAKEKRIG